MAHNNALTGSTRHNKHINVIKINLTTLLFKNAKTLVGINWIHTINTINNAIIT